MRIQEKTLTILLILSLAMNVSLLAAVLIPEDKSSLVLSHPREATTCPVTTPTPALPEKVVGSGGAASMQAPVIIQRIEVDRGGPFAVSRVTEGGAMVNVSVEIVPGRGRVLVQTTPLMGVVFQDAANLAVTVAQNRSHVDLSGSDIIFSIQGPEEVSEIDGPSAGALMTTLLLSVLEGFPVSENVTVTGTIAEDGTIGPVGGILEKAKAAAASGKTILFLSEGNNHVIEHREEVRSFGGLKVARQQAVVVDTREFIEENFGIRVEYVDTIDELLDLVRAPTEGRVAPVTAVF
jgi:predicted S18 family serine protease